MTTSALRLPTVWPIAIALAACWGCHKPATFLEPKPRFGFHYDTAFEAQLSGDKPLPKLVEQAWRPYVETLDEPVAVVDWKEGVSTWEVFFATNCRLIAATADGDQQRFDNQALPAPLYGRAEVTLPRGRRGSDPKRDPPRKNPFGLPFPRTKVAEPDQTVHFENVRSVSEEVFADGVRRQVLRSRQHDLLLFVHGFNVNFESSLIRTAQISLDTPFNGAVVAYSWPTQGGVNHYEDDEPVNADSVQPFAEFLQGLLQAMPEGTRINIVVHSMGNRIVMQVLNRLPPPGPQKPIANVVLCAPDVGLSDFRKWAPGVAAQSQRVTLYANAGDSALIISKGLHAEQRAGDADPPVIVPGIETVDCTAVDFNFMGHSYYSGNVDVLSDLFAVIKEQHSAEQRPWLTRQSLGPDGQAYWEFNNNAPLMLWTWHFEDTAVR